MLYEDEVEKLADQLTKSDDEHELAENLARAIDSVFGGFHHSIEAYRTEEFLTTDQIIRLNIDGDVWLLTVQRHR